MTALPSLPTFPSYSKRLKEAGGAFSVCQSPRETAGGSAEILGTPGIDEPDGKKNLCNLPTSFRTQNDRRTISGRKGRLCHPYVFCAWMMNSPFNR
jgi:hypothetical protein